MTTETPERSIPRVPAPMPVGGAVTAIVPQSFEEIQRVANTVITGGIAPASLIKWPKDNDDADTVRDIGRRNVAAVAGVLMAGAELGVPPMAALRLFTSINGRPALYADGNIAVARRAKDPEGKKIAASISSGCEMVYDYGCPYCSKTRESKEDVREHIKFAHKDQDPTEPAILILSDRTFGWCEAKRADTGELKREEFSIADAKLALLWDESPTVTKYGWYENDQGTRVKGNHTTQNDSPWHRYWKRMLRWRAIGYCLRELFADVLAGMLDEFEAREIEGMVNITPQLPSPTNGRPQPPQAPLPEDENQDASNEAESATAPAADATNQADDATEGMTLAEADVARQAELHNSDQPAGAENEVGDDENPTQPGGADTTSTTSKEEPEAESSTLTTAEPPIAPEEPPEPGSDEWFERLEIYLKETKTVDDIEDLWTHLDIESELSSTSIATMDRADELKKHHVARVGGQGDLLGGQ